MNIAVACKGLEVAPYFTQSTNYMCYAVERGIITGSKNIPAFDQSLESFIELLHSIEIDTLIMGRIEYGMASRMCRSGIEVVAGAEGESIEVAKAYLSRTLAGTSEPCSIEEPAATEEELFA